MRGAIARESRELKHDIVDDIDFIEALWALRARSSPLSGPSLTQRADLERTVKKKLLKMNDLVKGSYNMLKRQQTTQGAAYQKDGRGDRIRDWMKKRPLYKGLYKF